LAEIATFSFLNFDFGFLIFDWEPERQRNFGKETKVAKLNFEPSNFELDRPRGKGRD
jgi:hypothetical protein